MKRTTVVLIVLAACGEVTEDNPDAGGEADAPAAVDAAPPSDAPDVPMISEVLAAECGAYVPGSGVGAGNDLHKVTLDDPEAVCNDGTPAVMYVRPSSGGANADSWVFYLQGGSSCGDAQQCAIRYCGLEKYTKAKMSSTWTPMVATTDGNGLLDRDGTNPIAEANLVLMYYCSSDQWMGRKADSVLGPVLQAPEMRLHFRGHDIIVAALDELLAGPVTSDDGAVTMPSLATADVVLWSGTSAGGNGAEQNLDYVAGRMSAGTVVHGVFDAQMPPQPADLGDPAATEFFESYDRATYWPRVLVGAWDAFVDTSCLAMHPTDAWRCGQNEHAVLHHITTPFLVRQDLRDAQVGGRYLNAGATTAELAAAYRRTLARVPDIRTTAEERARITRAPGLCAPNCAQHVGLSNDEFYEESTLSGYTLRQAILAWYGGMTIDLLDTHPPTLSQCALPLESSE